MCSKVLLALVAALAITSTVSAQDNITTGGNGIEGSGKIFKYDGLVDFLTRANGTELLWDAVELVINSGVDPELVAALNDTATIANVFAPTNEAIEAFLANNTDALSDPAGLARVLRYHVVPTTAYKLDELTEGLWLQTLLPGEEGKLLVHKGANQKKPSLKTTSGQTVPIYRFNMETNAGAQLMSIKGVLVPGSVVPSNGNTTA